MKALGNAIIIVVGLMLLTSLCEAESNDGTWGEGATLPANARRQVSEAHLQESKILTRVSDLKTSGVNLKTSLADLLGNLKGLRVEENELEYRIIFESDILFDFDKASIRKDAEPTLKTVAEALVQFKGKRIRLVGHTDSKGSDSYNDKLSQKRAESVKSWFSRQVGLSGMTFTAEGMGEREPRVPNNLPNGQDDPDGRQKNRRVEIRIPKK